MGKVRVLPHLGVPELVIVLVIFMLIFGVGKLPVVRRWIWPLRAQPGVSTRLGPLDCRSIQYPLMKIGGLPCRS